MSIIEQALRDAEAESQKERMEAEGYDLLADRLPEHGRGDVDRAVLVRAGLVAVSVLVAAAAGWWAYEKNLGEGVLRRGVALVQEIDVPGGGGEGGSTAPGEAAPAGTAAERPGGERGVAAADSAGPASEAEEAAGGDSVAVDDPAEGPEEASGSVADGRRERRGETGRTDRGSGGEPAPVERQREAPAVVHVDRYAALPPERSELPWPGAGAADAASGLPAGDEPVADAAVPGVSRELAEDRRRARELARQASALADAGDVAGAVSRYRRAIEVDSGLIDAYSSLGVLLTQEGRYGEAIRALRSGLEASGGRPGIAVNLAIAHLEAGDPGKAVDTLREVIATGSAPVEAYLNLGVAYRRMGRLDAAETALRKALDRGGNPPMAHYNLARVLEADGRTPEAITHYARFLESGAGRQELRVRVQTHVDRLRTRLP